MTDPRVEMRLVHQTLLEIRSQHGDLTPQVVVDEARDDAHPLHSRFEWDDSVAGEAYRRVQAAELIRSVKVVYAETPEGEERKVRAWSSTRQGNGYKPTEEILQDDFSRTLLLRQAEREITALKRKYGHLKEFADILNAAAAEVA